MAAVKGWRFPVEPDPATGRIRTAEDNEAVGQGIRILLGTERGERKLLPAFGAGLNQFMFETVDLALVHEVSERVVETVRRWESHTAAVSADVSREDAGVRVEVLYRTDLAPGREKLETHLDLNE